MRLIFILLFFSSVLLMSCVSHQKLTHMHSIKSDAVFEQINIDSIYEYRLMPGDRVGLKIVSTVAGNTDIVKDIFEEEGQGTGTSLGPNASTLNGYIIDNFGYLTLPMIKEVYVQGLTLNELDSVVTKKLSEYINYIYVKSALYSYRITVLGEVGNPNTFIVNQSNLNLYQAVGLAGDFTDFSNKKRVKVVRKTTSTYDVFQVDMSSLTVLNSHTFQLMPNDVVYVEPLKGKILRLNSPILQYTLSAFSLVVLIFTLVQK